MSNNGRNDYGVEFSRIMFLEKIIGAHNNVTSFERRDDIVFEVRRTFPDDQIQIVCVDEYVLSEATARRILSDFPNTDIIFVGGKWNHATGHATDFGRDKKVTVCNAGNVNAALSKTQWREK
jgi:precorrin-6B methylase 2